MRARNCAHIHKYTHFYTTWQVNFFFAIPIWNGRPLLGIGRRIFGRPGTRPRNGPAAGIVNLYAGNMAPALMTNKQTAAANCAALRVGLHINFFWGIWRPPFRARVNLYAVGIVARTGGGGRAYFRVWRVSARPP